MATKRKDSVGEIPSKGLEALRVRLMHRWADHVLGADHTMGREYAAHRDRAAEYDTRAVRAAARAAIGTAQQDEMNARQNGAREAAQQRAPLTAADRNAVDIVRWIASLYAGGRQPQAGEQEVLDAMQKLFRPVLKGEKLLLAVELIKSHAVRYLQAIEGDPDYQGNRPEQIAHQLAVHLWGEVDDGLEPLEQMTAEVGELLEQYKASKGRRTKDGKHGGKLAASGILAELNTMAGWPLGDDLDAHKIDSAINRLQTKSRGA